MKLTFSSALIAGAVVTLAALSLTACAAGGTAGSTSGSTSADDSLAKVQKAGTLTVGTEGT